jgi:hypothetical protein
MWIIGLSPVDLSSLAEYTRSLHAHHHSAPCDLGTQAPPATTWRYYLKEGIYNFILRGPKSYHVLVLNPNTFCVKPIASGYVRIVRLFSFNWLQLQNLNIWVQGKKEKVLKYFAWFCHIMLFICRTFVLCQYQLYVLVCLQYQWHVVGFEVLTAVVMKSSVFWNTCTTPCSLLKVN